MPEILRPIEGARLPILRAAGEAFRFLFANFTGFIVIAILPLLLDEAIWFASYLFIGGLFDKTVRSVLSALPETLFTVAWCRFVLLGMTEAPPRLLNRWNGRHWRTLGVYFLVLLTYLPFADATDYYMQKGELEGGLAFVAGYIVIFAFLLIVVLRLSLAFCGIAVDLPFGPRGAWRFSRGQGFRLLIAVLIAFVPAIVLSIVLEMAFESWTNLASDWPDDYRPPNFDWRLIPFSFVLGLIDFLAIALEMLVLCFAFRQVTGWQLPRARNTALATFD